MSEIEQKIAVLESEIKRQRTTLQIFAVVFFFSLLTKFSLQMKYDRVLEFLEELIRLITLLVS